MRFWQYNFFSLLFSGFNSKKRISYYYRGVMYDFPSFCNWFCECRLIYYIFRCLRKADFLWCIVFAIWSTFGKALTASLDLYFQQNIYSIEHDSHQTFVNTPNFQISRDESWLCLDKVFFALQQQTKCLSQTLPITFKFVDENVKLMKICINKTYLLISLKKVLFS